MVSGVGNLTPCKLNPPGQLEEDRKGLGLNKDYGTQGRDVLQAPSLNSSIGPTVAAADSERWLDCADLTETHHDAVGIVICDG